VPALNPVDAIHPWILQDLAGWGFTVDGEPARLVPSDENGRVTLIPGRVGWDVEFVAADVPAFGWKRVLLERSPKPIPDTTQELAAGEAIDAEGVRVQLLEDGCFDLEIGGAKFRGLGELEDVGDRGDTYDFDEVASGPVRVQIVRAEYRAHPAGLHQVEIERELQLPARLEADRETRSRETVTTRMHTTLRWARGVPRLDLEIRVEDPAEDHRLRVLFPVAAGEAPARAATTFGIAERTPGALDSSRWIHPAPATFDHQGWIEAGGLTVVVPGLCEGEIIARETGQAIAVTLLRCVGHLSRHDLRTRPGPAGPGTETPRAQCPEPLRARLSLFAGFDLARAAAVEGELRAVPAGAAPRVAEGEALLSLEPTGLVLSALKPAQDGDGLVLRLQNPGDEASEARIELGFPVREAHTCRLDEQADPDAGPVALESAGRVLRVSVPARALCSLRLR
jgi:alpha-mannosidase/mannosylglycerate hydrolase